MIFIPLSAMPDRGFTSPSFPLEYVWSVARSTNARTSCAFPYAEADRLWQVTRAETMIYLRVRFSAKSFSSR